MIVADTRSAHLRLILVSADKEQVSCLKRDLQNSNYLYAFYHMDSPDTLVADVQAQLARGVSRLPLVLIVNHSFAKSDCEILVRYASEAKKTMAIECVVTDPPKDGMARTRLQRLGARLFDGNPAEIPMELSVH